MTDRSGVTGMQVHIALGELSGSSGRALGELWECSGSALGVLWESSGRALGDWSGVTDRSGVTGMQVHIALGEFASSFTTTITAITTRMYTLLRSDKIPLFFRKTLLES